MFWSQPPSATPANFSSKVAIHSFFMAFPMLFFVCPVYSQDDTYSSGSPSTNRTGCQESNAWHLIPEKYPDCAPAVQIYRQLTTEIFCLAQDGISQEEVKLIHINGEKRAQQDKIIRACIKDAAFRKKGTLIAENVPSVIKQESWLIPEGTVCHDGWAACGVWRHDQAAKAKYRRAAIYCARPLGEALALEDEAFRLNQELFNTTGDARKQLLAQFNEKIRERGVALRAHRDCIVDWYAVQRVLAQSQGGVVQEGTNVGDADTTIVGQPMTVTVAPYGVVQNLNKKITATKIIDLTQPMYEGMPFWPGGVPFKMERLVNYDQGYLLHKFTVGENTGTHVDAPVHFVKGNQPIDGIPLNKLVVPIAMIDVQQQAGSDPDYQLSVSDIEAWEAEHGRMEENSLVVLNTGWHKKFADPIKYVNQDVNDVMHFPGYSPESARLLVDRNISGIGIDTLSLDHGPSKDFATHWIMLKANKYQIENMGNLDALPPKGAVAVIGVLPVKAGSQAQARIFALLP